MNSPVQNVNQKSKCYIVQIGLDEDVFSPGAAQDSRERQIAYARSLQAHIEHIHVLYIVVTQNDSYETVVLDEISFIPCHYTRLRNIFSFSLFLKRLLTGMEVALLTTQDVHGVFWAAVIYAWLRRLPIVGQLHYDISSSKARKELFYDNYGNWYESLVKVILRFFSGIRVVSSASIDYLKEAGFKNRICLCPVPVTLYTPEPDNNIAQWCSEDNLKVLFVGRFVPVKNLKLWLDTARLIIKAGANVEFVLVGDGPDKPFVNSYIQKFNLEKRIKLTGSLPPERVACWYDTADVLMLTSHHEGFGRVVIESMHYGVVPVSTDTQGPSDIIDDGINGYIKPAISSDLSQCLSGLSRDAVKLRDMSRQAKRKAIECYKPEELLNEWTNYLLSFSCCR